MSPTTFLLFLLGIALLLAGAELLIRGASRLAVRLGLSPLVIGLTVVAFGTSAPELAVSVQAGLTGEADIALGNVVGSNIFNVLFILGLSAVVAPLAVDRQLVRLDVPLLIVVSLLLFALAMDGTVGRFDGVLLTSVVVAYTAFLFAQARRKAAVERKGKGGPEEGDAAGSGTGLSTLPAVAAVVVGLALLVLGSRWMVEGAVAVAEALGVSRLVIALTIIAAGTSLPEAATSILASIRGQRDIAVGNVLGSCLFNVLAIVGISSLVAPDGLAVAPSALRFDLPIMIAVSIACLPILFTGHRIDRWEGLLFIGYYVAYTLYLILDAAEHDALPAFSAVMGLFVIPLTLVTVGGVTIRAMRGQGSGPS